MLCLIAFLFLVMNSKISNAQTTLLFEAEHGILSGEANIVRCDAASAGLMVRGISSGRNNSLEFDNIEIAESREYFIKLTYVAKTKRSFTYELNKGTPHKQDVGASGDWCFEGGGTASFIFSDSLESGTHSILFYDSPIIDKITILSDTSGRSAQTIYLSSSSGSDDNDGMTPSTPWASLNKFNNLELVPGDSILFKSGDVFLGQLILFEESGLESNPIFIGKYGGDLQPVLDGDGYLSTIQLINSGHIVLEDLSITNARQESQPGQSTNLRYGLYFVNTSSDGTIYADYQLRRLTFKDIYPTEQITDDDQTGTHAHAIITTGSWMDELHPDRFVGMLIEDCYFTRTGRHATFFKAVRNLVIRNNLFEYVGGAGMVIGNNCSDVLVEHNETRYTGSSIDPRMAGRGSGIWCFRSKKLTVQHNQFRFARGIKDSYGMHIDIGNEDVVFQYNLSEGNEGGFVEVLGANKRVGYRFNISIGDGWRKRGNQLGRVFWIGGWSGTPNQPIGSDSVFIYNNSIFIPDTIRPRIWIEAVTHHSRIWNNIIYASSGLAEVFIKNPAEFNDFNHNIWYGNIPLTDTDGDFYRGEQTLILDPLLFNIPATSPFDLQLQPGSPARQNGHPFTIPACDTINHFCFPGRKDFFGNALPQPLNIGAYQGDGLMVGSKIISNDQVAIFPNPISKGHPIFIRLTDLSHSENLEIRIFDVNGKLLFTKKSLGENNISIETETLQQGIYFLGLAHSDVIKGWRKIIIL